MCAKAAPLLLCALALVAPSSVRAEWSRQIINGAATFEGVASPDGEHIFVTGARLDTSNLLRPFRNQVMTSNDGGRTFRDISGSLNEPSPFPLGSVFFIDTEHGWTTSGDEVHRTTDGGSTWSTTDVGLSVGALHFFDALRGLAAGEGGAILRTEDGGATWSPVTSPTTVYLRQFFWLDDERGWVTGFDQRKEDNGDFQDTYEEGGAVLWTTDGGATWQAGATFQGEGLGPVFFLDDGQTGWLATFTRPDASDPFDTDARLLRTVDGGRTFNAVNLPLELGSISIGRLSNPILLSRIVAMHWQDGNRGRITGTAHLATTTSGMSGGGSSTRSQKGVFEITSYVTTDGGATWQYNEIGDIMISGFPPQIPPGDGYIGQGLFFDHVRGWMAGESSIWRFSEGCTSDAECGPGFECGPDNTCLPEPPPPTPDAGPGIDAGPGAGGPDAGTSVSGDGGSTMPGTNPGTSEPPGSQTGGEGADEAGGCGCRGSPGGASASIWLLLVGAALVLRRRATCCRR